MNPPILTLAEVREAAMKYHQITKCVVFVGGIEQPFVDLLNAAIAVAVAERKPVPPAS